MIAAFMGHWERGEEALGKVFRSLAIAVC